MINLSGEELYTNYYAKSNLEINFCEVDQWDDLASEEQEMWNYFAQLVNNRE